MSDGMISQLLPDTYEEVARRRKVDPAIDEICRDIEMLERELGSIGEEQIGEFEEEVRRVLRALGDELGLLIKNR